MSILSGIKIIEIQGIGPGPFCGMLLADLGAEVVVIERPGPGTPGYNKDTSITKRGKTVITLDLKNPADRDGLLALITKADGLIEGMRPGVMERLGLGPDVCLEANPRLAYGRMTGWGQDGPMAQAAGHDINYIALSGALWFSSPPGQPPFAPPTLVGDIAGGALYLAIGLLSTILNARSTGKGDVIDAAMIDGTGHMMNLLLSLKTAGRLDFKRGQSMLDGPHWYDSYECKDGNFITIGPVELKFYNILLELLGLAKDPDFKDHYEPKKWPSQKEKLRALFLKKTRQEWCGLLEGSDACFAPVLRPDEAQNHSHTQSRGLYFENHGHLQTAPAPKFRDHPSKLPTSPAQKNTLSGLNLKWST